MHYQIFVPKVGAANLLDELDMSDFKERAEFKQVHAGQGPDGMGGTVFAWPRAGQPWGVNLEQQTWTACDGYYFGTWNRERPLPADLQRSVVHRGSGCVLGDGNQWLIPSRRKLPHDMVPTNDGFWIPVAKPEFKNLLDDSLYWLGKFQNGRAEFDLSEVCGFCATLLRMNYRLTPEIVGLLGLLDTQNVERPLSVFLDTEIAMQFVVD